MHLLVCLSLFFSTSDYFVFIYKNVLTCLTRIINDGYFWILFYIGSVIFKIYETVQKIISYESRKEDVAEAGVEDVAPDGKPLHLRCLDVRGQTNDQQIL